MSMMSCRVCKRGGNFSFCCGVPTISDEGYDPEELQAGYEQAIKEQEQRSAAAASSAERQEAERLKKAYEDQIAPLRIMELEEASTNLAYAIAFLRAAPEQNANRTSLLEVQVSLKKQIRDLRWSKNRKGEAI